MVDKGILLQHYIFGVGCLQGLILALLLGFDSRVNSASKILGLLCLFLSFSFLLPFIVQGTVDYHIGWLIGPIYYLPACYGALSFLYVRTLITARKLSIRDSIHLFPISICYFINADILFNGHQILELVGPNGEQNPLFWKFELSQTVVFLQALLYAVKTLQYLVRYRFQASQNFAHYNPQIFNWLMLLQVIYILIWSLKCIFHYGHISTILVPIADIVIVIFIYIIGWAQWRNQQLFTMNNSIDIAMSHRDQSIQTVASSLISQDTYQNLLVEIKQKMEQQKLFQQSDLTLASLAASVGITPHLLSEVLNQYEGINFHTFINQYRVDEVCKGLKNNADRNILDLAYDAGFSSKSAFNAIFKKVTGLTPSQYRRSLAES